MQQQQQQGRFSSLHLIRHKERPPYATLQSWLDARNVPDWLRQKMAESGANWTTLIPPLANQAPRTPRLHNSQTSPEHRQKTWRDPLTPRPQPHSLTLITAEAGGDKKNGQIRRMDSGAATEGPAPSFLDAAAPILKKHPTQHLLVSGAVSSNISPDQLSRQFQRHSIAISPSPSTQDSPKEASPPESGFGERFRAIDSDRPVNGHQEWQSNPPNSASIHHPLLTPNSPVDYTNNLISLPKNNAPSDSLLPALNSSGVHDHQLMTPSSQPRRKSRKTCTSCGREISGQFVRALGNAYHAECFNCHQCGCPCSAKFFPHEVDDPMTGGRKQVALCELHYFGMLDLICFSCKSALRGPYITALNRKYHLEHFKCGVCKKVFESDESYYEHEDRILCHYHYSKLYAAHCQGCNSLIVKQFVALFRGGRNQQWHPECYMVHKFWNVCIGADSVGLQHSLALSEADFSRFMACTDRDTDSSTVEEIDPKLLLAIEHQIENLVLLCWLTLSRFEEVVAGSISNMLLNANTGNKAKGLLATGRLVLSIECLFSGLDYILEACKTATLLPLPHIIGSSTDVDSAAPEAEYFQNLKKEPRNICGKLMSYLAILRKSGQDQSNGWSAQLLSVITGCAHYLKLLIRCGLNNALKLNKILGTTEATSQFLSAVVKYKEFSVDNSPAVIQDIRNRLAVLSKATDLCVACSISIEKSCIKHDNWRWHHKCFECSECHRKIPVSELPATRVFADTKNILCKQCVYPDCPPPTDKFTHVSDLKQLSYLLKIAMARSQIVMKVQLGEGPEINKSRATVPHTSVINENESTTENDYTNTVLGVTTLRTRRLSQKLSNSINKPMRRSVVVEAPQGSHADQFDELQVVAEDGGYKRTLSNTSQFSFTEENEALVQKEFQIRDEPVKTGPTHLDRTSDLLKNEKSLTLDDIPRIVAAEQARDQRPNAFKHHNSLYQRQPPRELSRTALSHKPTMISPSSALDTIINSPPVSSTDYVPKTRYYSELSKHEHFIIRHIAVEALTRLKTPAFNKEELLSAILTKKLPTFWDKFKFNTGDSKRDKNMSVFGVDLQDVTRKYGTDSDLGVGPSRLRIPIVVDDIICSLRQKDMSVEGIFRLNGNIKSLRQMTESINKSPTKSPEFSELNAVQLAALLKKWLRELPNPLLTFSLHDLWISSLRELDSTTRKRILQLAYCLLPRSHRNLLEVLLYFFSWVASFAEIDEETGSKMDAHNLATVIAPNILVERVAPGNEPSPLLGDTYFLAIEVVNLLIEFHEELLIIPEDLMQCFQRCGFESMRAETLTTKEVLQILDKTLAEDPTLFDQYDKMNVMTSPEGLSNEMVHSNTVCRRQSKVSNGLHGETSRVE